MNLKQLSGEKLTEVQKIYNEDPLTRHQFVEDIKNWLEKQPHLPSSWENEDLRLLNFLRGCSFSLELCKKKLDKYFTVRGIYPELFTNRDVKNPDIQELFEIADAAILPDLTPKGSRVCVLRSTRYDFETPNMEEAFKCIFMVGDIRINIEQEIINGDVFILDANFNLPKHFLNVPLILIKRALECFQEAYPAVVKEVHVLNAPSYVHFILNILRPFLNENIRNSIIIHKDIETLYDFVPKDILPKEYGGKGATMSEYKKLLLKTMEDYTEWFQQQEDVKSDESKRPGVYCHDDIFGLEGSFRTLNID